MSRRASLPGASELFRLTSSPALEPMLPVEMPKPKPAPVQDQRQQLERSGGAAKRGTGRQKHDSKITVYVSGDELVAMEQARLALRATHGLVIDRGRLVREAVAVLLADFEQHGPDSVLVQRLRDHQYDAEEATGS
ncbi:cobyrinic acid a,c-diamide synthase [Amycolatopsis acidicola]|uniref:Cobyrinic acid a,c-diamide synthase n=1 Tax=Amycolatopsis acidicola TaxID=2596893 RepID=A0A5N0UL50_9PSEU|nr:cobyrinic acid a,c-diamide synthase [Amycolatopsis acidicola]KAA9150453.1 cobyrinic acid a,c-diamide synthase [Amycolatopsis acidicola]